jgi:hypothetical protein
MKDVIPQGVRELMKSIQAMMRAPDTKWKVVTNGKGQYTYKQGSFVSGKSFNTEEEAREYMVLVKGIVQATRDHKNESWKDVD